MNAKQIRKIIPELEKRNKLIIERYNRGILMFRRISYLLMGGLFVTLILFVPILIDCINTPSLFKELGTSIFITPIIAGMVTLRWYLNSHKIEVTEKKGVYIDIWASLRRRYITDMFFYFLFGVLLAIFGDINETSTLFIISTFIFYLIFVLTIVAIRINPKLIINGLINQIGSTSLFLHLISYLYFTYSSTTGFDFFNCDAAQLSSFLLFTAVILFIAIGFQMILSQTINQPTFTQSLAIVTINPNDLIISLRDERKIIEDKSKAVRILQNIEEDVSPGIKAELLKLIVKEHTGKKRIVGYVISFIMVVLVFITTSVGRALVQDVLYKGHLKPFLCKFFETFC